MKISGGAVVMLVIIYAKQKSLFLNFTEQLLAMYKHTFSGTGDGFAVENVDDVYPIVNIECMSDTYD